MEENFIKTDPLHTPELEKRPQLLSVLCVLSFIWSGLVAFFCLFAMLASGFIFNLLGKLIDGDVEGMPTMDDKQLEAIHALLNFGQKGFVLILALTIVIYLISFIGVLKMWQLKKTGFYIYVSVNTAMAIYYIFTGSIFMAIIALLFIVLYRLNFKFMK